MSTVERSGGRIVVGVDNSENSRRALRWAVEEARRRGAVVEAVQVWTSPYSRGQGPLFPVDDAHLQTAAAESLHAAVEAILSPSDIRPEIVETVLEGIPAAVLCDRSAGAELLVVGSRGHGGFAGLLLGSVSSQCAHHARCPLAIIPPGD